MGILLKTVVAVAGMAVASACGSAASTEPRQEATAASAEAVTPTPTDSPTSATPTPTPSTTRVVETEELPYPTRTVRDPDLDRGRRSVRTDGVPGRKTLIYEVTLIDGEPIGRRLVESKVSRKPVAKVVAVGTRERPEPEPEPASTCDPNYSGCVPIASDVDCAGGSGDGPAYVSGPVRVTGVDIYDLDSDGDGYGCED